MIMTVETETKRKEFEENFQVSIPVSNSQKVYKFTISV